MPGRGLTTSGSIDIVCKNYKRFWFEEYPDMKYQEDYSIHFSTDYCDMKIEGNTIQCEFMEIETHQPEEFKIVVTAGDIFFYFNIDIN